MILESGGTDSVVFEYQVGGHHTITRHPSCKNLILKASVEREIAFYRRLEESGHPLFQHVPKFSINDGSMELIIEDLTFGMQSPSILDVKIGSRLYDIDATPHKIQKRIHKANTTSSGRHGFRLCGIRTHDLGLLRKADLLHVDDESLVHYLDLFFDTDYKRSMMLGAMDDIKRSMMQSNVELISSSILVVYDEMNPSRMHCKMIDFAHSHMYAYPHSDHNYLQGLASLTRFIAKD